MQKNKTPQKANEQVPKWVEQFHSWRDDLKQYWSQMDAEQDLYEFYREREESTATNISLNTPFAIIESMVAKANESKIAITAKAKGEDRLKDFEEWVSSTVKGAIEDPDIAERHGTFRKIREQYFRTFLVTGNSAACIEYCYKTEVGEDGTKKVLVDNPYTYTIPWKQVIFNPSRRFDTSDIYYVEKWVSWNDLKNNEYSETKGKDGETVKSGRYHNIQEVKKAYKDKDRQIDDDETDNISGDKKISRKLEPVHIIERWQGAKFSVIAITGQSSGVVIREEIDPFKLGGHNLLLSVNYVIEGRPYGYGEVSAMYKPVRAQDTIVNQSIDLVNRRLRPSVLIDPNQSETTNIDALMNVIEFGGAMFADSKGIGSVPTQDVPGQAFTTIETLQMAIERAARFSPYSTGVASSSTDKTQGTPSGIQSIQAAAEPNFAIKLDTLQDSFLYPLCRKYLKMIASLMSEQDIRHTLLSGKAPGWVKVVKGILRGQATISDLVRVGMISEEEANEFLYTEEEMVDPATGQMITQSVPIEGADEAYVFDVDWILDVKMNNQAEADKNQKAQAILQWAASATAAGVQLDQTKVHILAARDLGIDDPEELVMKPEDMQPQMMGMAGSEGMGSMVA